LTPSSEKAQVSVVIPCYRCAQTIERAIESVGLQTVRPAQVILVDDGSGDGTIAKLRDIKQRCPADWVRIIPLGQNAGPAVARNAGWDAATQPYVAFLDADDTWHPRKLEIQYGWMYGHPKVALTGHVILQNGASWPIPSDNFRAQQIDPRRLLFSNVFPTTSVILLKDLPIRFHPAKRHSEDYLLWLQIVTSGHLAFVLDLPLARRHTSACGEARLSRNLWAMEREELANYKRLRDGRLISRLMHSLLVPYSLAKFLRRACSKLVGY